MSTKRKPGIEYEYVDLFPHPYKVSLVTSEEEWEQVMKDWKIRGERPRWIVEGAYGEVHQLENRENQLLVVSINPPKKSEWQNVAGVIAHEATHCAQIIFRHMGERDPSKELQAYAVQMITLTLLEQYKKKKGR